MEEKVQLKAGLSSMLEHKHGLESALQAASEELVELQTQVSFRRLTLIMVQRSSLRHMPTLMFSCARSRLHSLTRCVCGHSGGRRQSRRGNEG